MEHLSAEELDAILEHAFDRYYSDSGLFGNPSRCLTKLAEVAAAGVDDIACLIDFGIEEDDVLAGLTHLRDVLDRSRATHTTSASFAETARTSGATHVQFTPSMAKLLLADPDDRAALSQFEHVLVGGEALSAATATELRTAVAGRLTNMYGPTETTIWSTSEELESASKVREGVTIGTPIANTFVYVIDSDGDLVPDMQPGELVIGGASVTSGYFGLPDLTATRFVRDRFTPGGDILYRTGDRCRFLEDGRLQFLGRIDDQVKIRGHRIEPGEVASVLSGLPGVSDSVVVAYEDGSGETALAAYVVVARPGELGETDILRSLAGSLPEYMIPTRIVEIDSLPMTPNGKLDRARLPSPAKRTVVDRSQLAVAPEKGVEEEIAAVWAELLEVDRVGATQNFFDIGGHSLLAVQAIARLSSVVDHKVSLVDFFRYPTVRSLAEHLATAAESAEQVGGRSSKKDGPKEGAAVAAGSTRAARRRAATQRRSQ